MIAALALASLLAAPASSAPAPSASEPPIVRPWLDGALTVAAFAGAGAFVLIDTQPTPLWARQLVGIDDDAKDNFSRSAISASDGMLVASIAAPLGVQLGSGGSAALPHTLVYAQTLGVSLLVQTVVKHAVARPRPYAYNLDDAVAKYAAREGEDARHSFYSGHASAAFAAAVSGGYLFAQTTSDERARAGVWALNLALAGATANLRVRAGKHFPSDVVVGAAMGSAVGYLVPRLHYRGRRRARLGALEWFALALAPVVGAGLGQLLPVGGETTAGVR